jgi:hypothetical protein
LLSLASWHGPDGRRTSVLLLGNLAGGHLLRTLVLDASAPVLRMVRHPSRPTWTRRWWDYVEQKLDLIGAMGE